MAAIDHFGFHFERLMIDNVSFERRFLSLIVLGCAYKSKLVNSIVLPTYIYPPNTFKELVESGYKIGAVFWAGALDTHFRARTDQIGEEIVKRAKEYAFFNQDVIYMSRTRDF